ncbi:MAG: CRISPR system precrRNA processing endoribonuclease RAMP protein Cas6 [Candidatus Binatia bacterium]|nr:CRISPR system precrRNA processing endoribonuclease RAMP protein Cas6 [Candidatus Binatia bacterium]
MTELPRLHVWLVHYEVTRAGVLPPLPTTALHGALARTLYDDVCVAPARLHCDGCPAQLSCAYPTLFEPTASNGARARPFGVTTEPPRPLAIAPDKPFLPTSERPFAVKRGDILTFRIVATGCVWQYWKALRKALQRVGHRGLGPHGSRATLELAEVVELTKLLPTEPVQEVTLSFVTPLRIKHQGRIASQLDPSMLFEAIVRRARLLSLFEAQPWEPPAEWQQLAGSLHSVADLRLVRVGRYSGRQGRWMLWPGLVGTMRLSGDAVNELLPLLHFGSLAQIGKASTFGFGRYDLGQLRYSRTGADAGGVA